MHEAEAVRVEVLLAADSEDRFWEAFGVDGGEVTYKSARDEDTKSLRFDRVVRADSVEGLHCELLPPLSESVLRGWNVALLVCGTARESVSGTTDQSFIRKVLTELFSCVTSRVPAEQLFMSVSFLQFYPDGDAEDLLSFDKETLRLEAHPVLGSVVDGLGEVCVDSAEEAFNVYEASAEKMKLSAGPMSGRCSYLFSVAVEWRLHPDRGEADVCRSRLQLFGLAGGASRTDLRGVNPLVKVLDQILNPAAPPRESLLPALLTEALTGNAKTLLIYVLHSLGPLDDETPAALSLAQKVRGLLTRPTAGRWNPKSSEREIRRGITELQNLVMSQGQSEARSIHELARLTKDLKMVKNQSWEKRREESQRRKGKVTKFGATNGSSNQIPEHKDDQETVKHLQEQLRQEMEEHIREGGGSAESVQERAARIQQLKEALREEPMKTGAASLRSRLHEQSQLEYNEAQERRRRLKEDHMSLIQEEVARMEQDLAQQQQPTDSPQRELLVLSRERQLLVLQAEALRAEARQAEADLQSQQHRHQTELHRLREESLQVFRVFRQISEEQRKLSEGRYRSVLLEAVQDAIYLSAQNQQLQAENKQLRKALGEVKDALAVRGDPEDELSSGHH